MYSKKQRYIAIKEIIRNNKLSNQEELLNLLKKRGFDTTQATLSRDIKQLKIIKSPDNDGNYAYILPKEYNYTESPERSTVSEPTSEYATIGFSGQLAVLKTRPGHASAIAFDIDNKAQREILGTIAGDDTILIIPKEGISREEIINILSSFIKVTQ